jgi:hypothetical protein
MARTYVRVSDLQADKASIRVEWVADGFHTHSKDFTVQLH